MNKKFLNNIKRIKFLMECRSKVYLYNEVYELDEEELDEEELDEEELDEQPAADSGGSSSSAGTPGVWASGRTFGKTYMNDPKYKWDSGLTRGKANQLK